VIKIGAPLPAIPLRRLKGSSIETVNLTDQIKGKKVILFAVPGAFTPTCSEIHLPSFIKQADALKAKGIDEIYCIAVNDPYVLDVWGKVVHAAGKVTLLSDGNGAFTKAMGLLLEENPVVGLRSKRYVAILEDGIVTSLQIEPSASQCTITCADHIVDML
jgi:glutaredoxin/glutathione-dependent peroxiredoxin